MTDYRTQNAKNLRRTESEKKTIEERKR